MFVVVVIVVEWWWYLKSHHWSYSLQYIILPDSLTILLDLADLQSSNQCVDLAKKVPQTRVVESSLRRRILLIDRLLRLRLCVADS